MSAIGVWTAVFWGSILLLLALTILLPFALSLEADEAWILLGIKSVVSNEESLHRPVTTTGGIYFLAETLLYRAFGARVFVLRLFPLACLALLLVCVSRWSGCTRGSPIGAIMVPVTLAAIPGTLVFGALAFGAVPATLLIFLGLEAYIARSRKGSHRWALSGVLFGAAIATRPNCVAILPAILFLEWLESESRPTRLWDAFRTGLVASSVFAVCHVGLLLLSHDSLHDALVGFGVSAGASQSLLKPQPIMGKLVIANSHFPFPLLVATTVLGCWLGRIGMCDRRRIRLLLLFGWILWVVWVLKVPSAHPHLRYLWPSLAAFAAVLGIGLARWHANARESGDLFGQMSTIAIGTACVWIGLATTSRAFFMADSTRLFMEWRERMPVQVAFPVFKYCANQRAMATYIGSLPVGEEIAVLDFAKEIEFLSGRELHSLHWYASKGLWNKADLPRRILVTMHTGTRVHLSPEAQLWFLENCTVEAQFGSYKLYRVHGEYPEDPGLFRLSHRPASIGFN